MVAQISPKDLVRVQILVGLIYHNVGSSPTETVMRG